MLDIGSVKELGNLGRVFHSVVANNIVGGDVTCSRESVEGALSGLLLMKWLG